MRNVTLTGGINHPFEESTATLSEVLGGFGFESVVTADVDEAVAELADADLFTLYALRWRMMDDEKYAPHRTQWAYELPEAHGDTIFQFVADGGAMLALHTACICFDTWYDFPRLLGGTWRWGQTFHPPLSDIVVRGAGVAEFALHDEVYHALEIADDSEALLEARTADGDWQTVAWRREQDEGRVVFSALGHDSASFRDTSHQRFLGESVAWLTGVDD